ncbi:hypothetical protein Pan216_52540 [Planctomycetes bacterium Pan216]|uniref:Uncharacterized protein n=1 Tax=Kolteria novifilia TaxID=2527975 RepID=A0A518BBJ3_9BACT|nr:hypothetical protein Pan216_52540 [Planctomycetes bacterium Pan216]
MIDDAIDRDRVVRSQPRPEPPRRRLDGTPRLFAFAMIGLLGIGCSRIDQTKFSPIFELASSFADATPSSLPDLRSQLAEQLCRLDQLSLTQRESEVMHLLREAEMEWMIADSCLDTYRAQSDSEEGYRLYRIACRHLDKGCYLATKALEMTTGLF